MNPYQSIQTTKSVSSISITLKFVLVQNLKEAEIYWKKLSPNRSIFDLWEYRYCFYKYYNYDLFFYSAFYNDELIWLLPLEWNKEKWYLEFFWGWDMENNQIFIKPWFESIATELLKQVKLPKKLDFMILSYQNLEFIHYTDSYFVETQKIRNFDEFIDTHFSSDRMKRTIKSLYNNHTIEIVEDNFEDIELLFQYKIQNFQENCDIITNPYEASFERDLLEIFDSHTLTFIVDWKKQAVWLWIKHEENLFGISMGINYWEVNHLGKLVFSWVIDYAIKNNMKTYSAGATSYWWKDAWHLDKYPLYTYS